MPKDFWADAVAYTVYVSNKSPTQMQFRKDTTGVMDW